MSIPDPIHSSKLYKPQYFVNSLRKQIGGHPDVIEEILQLHGLHKLYAIRQSVLERKEYARKALPPFFKRLRELRQIDRTQMDFKERRRIAREERQLVTEIKNHMFLLAELRKILKLPRRANRINDDQGLDNSKNVSVGRDTC